MLSNYWDKPKSPFDPVLLGVDLRAHWSARDHGTSLMTDAGSGAISAWTDRVAGIVLDDAATAGNRPTWSATSMNSAYPGLTFNGTANCLRGTSFAALPTSTEPGMIWIVGQGTGSIDANTRVLCSYGSTTTGAFRRVQKGTTDVFTVGDGTTNGTAGSAAANATNQFVAWARFRPGFYTGATNGFTNVSAAGAGTLNTGGGTLRMSIGSSNLNTASSFYNSVISDVLVTADLDEVKTKRMTGYFAWLYEFQARLAVYHRYAGCRP